MLNMSGAQPGNAYFSINTHIWPQIGPKLLPRRPQKGAESDPSPKEKAYFSRNTNFCMKCVYFSRNTLNLYETYVFIEKYAFWGNPLPFVALIWA